uniref:Uncharacterized protein n=1 Tax=Panagrolaimus superbus TaxID=310955 RepID=A0A914XWG6_9BILA
MSKLNQKPTGVTATEEMGFEIPTDTYLTGVNPRKLQAYLNQRDPTMLTGYEIIGNDGKKAYIAPRPSPLKVEQIKKEPVYDPLKTAEPKITNSELQQVKEVKRGITKKERSVTPRLLKIKPAKQLLIHDPVKNDKSKIQTSTVLVEPIVSRSLELEPTRELNEHLKPVKSKKSVISEPQQQQQNEEEIIALNAHNTSPQSPPPPSTTSGSTTTTIASELPIQPPQKVQVRKVEREHTPPQSTSTTTTTCSTTTASEVPTQDLHATTTPIAAPRPINLTIKLSVHDPLKTAKTKSAATSERQEIHESQAGTNTADFATLPTRTKSNPTTCTTTECETLSNSKCSTTTLTSASSAPN